MATFDDESSGEEFLCILGLYLETDRPRRIRTFRDRVLVGLTTPKILLYYITILLLYYFILWCFHHRYRFFWIRITYKLTKKNKFSLGVVKPTSTRDRTDPMAQYTDEEFRMRFNVHRVQCSMCFYNNTPHKEILNVYFQK